MSPPVTDAARWRLILGAAAESTCGGLTGAAAEIDQALSWLYDRDPEQHARAIRRGAGLDPSHLTTPHWVNEIHRLFPRRTVERLERDALERFALEDLVTNPEVLARAKPNITLLKAVLRCRHLMAPNVLVLARQLVADVVRRLIEAVSREVALAFAGHLNRRRHSRLKLAANLDFKRAIHDNLRHYDPQTRRITPEKLRFFARHQRRFQPWQVILLVDQSGSMLDSVIHAAVMASCLWKLPGIRTHLIAFDTNIIDLTEDVTDPVETLMKVQLGGGTDIAQAVAYGASLIERPAQAIIVLITDFYEGGNVARLITRVKALSEQRTRVLGLAALDRDARPAYDRLMAQRLVAVGAEIGAMTPGELVAWLAEKIGT